MSDASEMLSRPTSPNIESDMVHAENEFVEYIANLKRNAEEKDDMIEFLRPPKIAKNEYLEQKLSKFVFKCSDGDIQIPEYGLLRTDFYYQERIHFNSHNFSEIIWA